MQPSWTSDRTFRRNATADACHSDWKAGVARKKASAWSTSASIVDDVDNSVQRQGSCSRAPRRPSLHGCRAQESLLRTVRGHRFSDQLRARIQRDLGAQAGHIGSAENMMGCHGRRGFCARRPDRRLPPAGNRAGYVGREVYAAASMAASCVSTVAQTFSRAGEPHRPAPRRSSARPRRSHTSPHGYRLFAGSIAGF